MRLTKIDRFQRDMKIIDTSKLIKLINALAVVASILLVTSCKSDEYPKVPEQKLKRTILIYAVASNGLYSNLISDKEEMLEAASNIDFSSTSLILYQVTPYGNPMLLELQKISKGKYDFVELKEYDRKIYSTDPRRISQVINDVLELREAETYGLILWSHGWGMDYYSKTRSDIAESEVGFIDQPLLYSFGIDENEDIGTEGVRKINIDDLAEVIPDRLFDFIWFDACYMSGIEMIYELRNKCETFVGYPTEILADGMPYNLTLPFIMKPNPDLVNAAKILFDHYANQIVTVAVVDMNYIEDIADYCNKAYLQAYTPPSYDLQVYTHRGVGPFYDFGQVTRLKAENSGNATVEEFDDIMSRFVKWSAATSIGFNRYPIDPENYSGISCFLYNPKSTNENTEYFRTLDWYKRTYSGQ